MVTMPNAASGHTANLQKQGGIAHKQPNMPKIPLLYILSYLAYTNVRHYDQRKIVSLAICYEHTTLV
jgi:hypothetical protein